MAFTSDHADFSSPYPMEGHESDKNKIQFLTSDLPLNGEPGDVNYNTHPVISSKLHPKTKHSIGWQEHFLYPFPNKCLLETFLDKGDFDHYSANF